MSLELGLVYFIGRITLDDFSAATVHILSQEKKRKEKKRKEKRKGRSNTVREAKRDKKPPLRLGQKDIEITWTQFT